MVFPRRRSLAGRLLIVYAAAVLVVLGLLGFLIDRAVRDALLTTVEDRLVQQAQAIASIAPDDSAVVPEFVARVAPEVDARITIIDADGTVLGDSHGDAPTMENHAARPEVVAAREDGVGSDRRVSESTGFSQLYVAVPGPEGQTVRVSLGEAIVNGPIGEFRGSLWLIVTLAAVLGVLAVALVGRFLSRPIARLTDVAQSVAAGNLEITAPRSSVTEVDALGRSIGSMASELGTRLQEVGDERRTLEVVLDALPQGTLLIDGDDEVLYANRSLVDLLGTVPERLDQVVPYRIQEMVRRARSEGETIDLDAEHGRPVRILRVIVSPFEDTRALVVVSDVTDRRRVDDVRRDFVTNASHELKTPVAGILASAETLQLAVERAPDRVPQFAAQIERSAQALSRLVSDLLDLSRLESRRSDWEEVSMAEVVAAEVDRIRPAAAARQIRLAVESMPAVVAGAGPDLGLAVRNLLDNAIHYSDPGARVTVRLEHLGGEVVVSVTDEGAGIPQRDLERIFERFYRVDEARSRATGGTGLGLSIVRHVVESHGGEVSVESQLSAGSTFTIRLPAGPGSSQAE